MKCDITLNEIENSYDWKEVFGEGNEFGRQDVESLDGTATDQVRIADISEIIAAVNGENAGDAWIGVFKMKDGRYLAASGWCDYTGWAKEAVIELHPNQFVTEKDWDSFDPEMGSHLDDKE